MQTVQTSLIGFRVALNGGSEQSYEFIGVNSFTPDDPSENMIVRGGDNKDSIGLAGKTGANQESTFTVEITNMSRAMQQLLDNIWESPTVIRFGAVYCIASDGGEEYKMSNAILKKNPLQTAIGDVDSATITIVFGGAKIVKKFRGA